MDKQVTFILFQNCISEQEQRKAQAGLMIVKPGHPKISCHFVQPDFSDSVAMCKERADAFSAWKAKLICLCSLCLPLLEKEYLLSKSGCVRVKERAVIKV